MGLLTRLFGSAVFAGPLAGAMLAQSPSPKLDLKVPDLPDFPTSTVVLKGSPVIKSVDLNAPSLKKFQYLAYGERTWELKGHLDYCSRLPQECMQTSDSGKMVVLDDDLKKRIETINRYVNSTIAYKRDEVKYKQYEKDGFVDHWTIPDDGEGDCEDYVLAKQKMLREMGIPKTAMSIVFVQAKEGHALLAVRTDKGDFLLDNGNDEVLLPHQTSYEFISATSMQNNAQWQKVALNAFTPEDLAEDEKNTGSGIGALISLTTQPVIEQVLGPLNNALGSSLSAIPQKGVPLPPRRPKGL